MHPLRASFQRELGSAYAKLGFVERARDSWQSALRLARTPEQQAEIRQLLAELSDHGPQTINF